MMMPANKLFSDVAKDENCYVDQLPISEPQGPYVVFACDMGYAMPLAIAIASLVSSYRGLHPICIYIVTSRFTPEARYKVTGSVDRSKALITWIFIDLDRFKLFETPSHVSKMTYARLQLPAILPASISKIIYLDADIVVLDDLSKLWMENVDDFALAAVSDSLDAQIKAGNLDVEGVPCVKHYFNAGVLLLNLDYWRRECISQRAFAYLDENPASPFADQDSLNVVCDGVWRRIDGRWNRQLSKDASISDFGRREVISVAHFVTWAKPWKAGVGNVNFRFYEELRNRTLFAKSRTDAIVDIGCFVIEKGKALFRFIRKNAKAKLYAQCRKPVALQSTPNK